MQRIVIVGCGGAGKSTLARRLGAITGLPVVHLDREFWQPGWARPADAAFDARLEELLAAPAWILDGNFARTMERRFAAADTIVFLDRPTIVCLFRALRRGVLGRRVPRPDLADGCPEQLPDLEFLRWIWRFRRRQRPVILRRLAALDHDVRIEILRSDAEVQRFLELAAHDARASTS